MCQAAENGDATDAQTNALPSVASCPATMGGGHMALVAGVCMACGQRHPNQSFSTVPDR
jgi:hypothetical protein